MRVSADIGGTFTDLVVEGQTGEFQLFKVPTTPQDPVVGILDALRKGAVAQGASLESFASRIEVFIHATTRATNAVLTNGTARTALLTTQGHRDILLYREGGRLEPFNNTIPYPDPYVPRSLTFEIPERINSAGQVVKPMNEPAVLTVIDRLRQQCVEAVGVCLLWSMLEPKHEARIGALLEKHLPGVPFTLSHQLNPAIREYRRASSTCIDASLKPLMSSYLGNLGTRLAEVGFRGRMLAVSSLGGVVDAEYMAAAPIHSVKSGPSIAPIAGRYYAAAIGGSDTAIVADTGGTSYDVTLVRDGQIPFTRETWLGEPLRGHMTGFPSVDVKSIGAGGGSIAWVDEGGMLHVGPQSAGSIPGPACYGKGGVQPTVTDAALVLGYIDPAYFLGGAIALDVQAAVDAVERQVAAKLAIAVSAAASAIFELATENMIHAIEEITINQGIDPATAILIGGGGAAGLNAVRIARRLGCSRVIIPAVGATLSAASALISDLSTEFGATCFTTSHAFDFDAVNNTLAELDARCQAFIAGPGLGLLAHSVDFFAEARYPHQIWEVEVPVKRRRFTSPDDVGALVEALHCAHEQRFSFRDANSEIEIVTWRARVSCRLSGGARVEVVVGCSQAIDELTRPAVFPDLGVMPTRVRHLGSMKALESVTGPAIVESTFTTVVIDPRAVAERTSDGSLSIRVAP